MGKEDYNFKMEVWNDIVSFVMFAGAAAFVFGVLWVGLDPPGDTPPSDSLIKVAVSQLGTIVGAVVIHIRGRNGK